MIFKYLDCRAYLRSLTQKASPVGKKYSFQDLAEVMRIQKSYMSRVMSGGTSLNQDQGFLLAEHLGLSSAEQNYLNLLIEFDRTAITSRKKAIKFEIDAIQQNQISTEKHINKKVHDNPLTFYYTNPLIQILHMACLLDNQTPSSINKMAEQLGVEKSKVEAGLQYLIESHFLEYKNGKYQNLAEDLHLKPEHPLTKIHHTLVRSYSTNRLQNLSSDDAYSFSATVTADEQTYLHIKSEYLMFLKRIEAAVTNSKSKGVYQISFDLFPWIKP